MATRMQIVLDCADPGRMTVFWAQALGYREQEPPAGFDSWEDFLRANNVPESEWNSAGAVVDPDGVGPRIYFQRVPEPKTVKNRMHVDLNVGGPHGTPDDVRRARIADEVARLEGLGATRLREVDEPLGYCWVMRDPEGNEFCVQ
jgi:glyoxalase superfamily protein